MNDDQMRSFILLAEAMRLEETEDQPLAETTPEQQNSALSPVLHHDLSEIIFRLRGFMETSGGEFALGVETGMQRAADMIENLIRRHSQGDDHVG